MFSNVFARWWNDLAENMVVADSRFFPLRDNACKKKTYYDSVSRKKSERLVAHFSSMTLDVIKRLAIFVAQTMCT